MTDTAKLSIRCRCGHTRRQHQRGTIWEGYYQTCRVEHPPGEYAEGCYDFEPIDVWQESFAALLRQHGYIVERVDRDEAGRFVKVTG